MEAPHSQLTLLFAATAVLLLLLLLPSAYQIPRKRWKAHLKSFVKKVSVITPPAKTVISAFRWIAVFLLVLHFSNYVQIIYARTNLDFMPYERIFGEMGYFKFYFLTCYLSFLIFISYLLLKRLNDVPVIVFEKVLLWILVLYTFFMIWFGFFMYAASQIGEGQLFG